MNDELKKWSDRLAKALQHAKEKYLIQRDDLKELAALLDALLDREEYGEI